MSFTCAYSVTYDKFAHGCWLQTKCAQQGVSVLRPRANLSHVVRTNKGHATLTVVYKIPYRRALGLVSFRPSARASKGILHTTLYTSYTLTICLLDTHYETYGKNASMKIEPKNKIALVT